MTQQLSVPSVFESFNARNLSPAQVAERFIPPPRHFDDLILRRHSLVVGPRGSGKTTLLKMLQLPALAAWQHPDADRYRANIDFTAIFIAADVSWGAQLNALGRSKLPQHATDLFGLAAFTSHVLIALTDAINECVSDNPERPPTLASKYVKISKSEEVGLCQLLARSWLLEPIVKTLQGLKLALRERLSTIAQIAFRETLLPPETLDARLAAHAFLYLGFLECATLAIEAFNDLIKQPERRWALLFDELEIAPQQIRRHLFAALRSTDQRLLFKLSISPYHGDAKVLETSSSAMPGQDYQPIELWYPKKEEGFQFSEALLRAMLIDAGLESASSEEVFGNSVFDAGDTEREADASAYRPGTSLHKRFVRLAEKDQSFSEYLRRNNIDLDQMHLLNETQRAGQIRKGTSVVAVRENYRSSEDLKGAPTRRERSRKASTLYTGSRAIFAIIEGNPRWFIGIVGSLIRDYRQYGHRVPRSIQARTITTATNRFRALLRTIPYHQPGSTSSRGLLSLLDTIGEFLHSNLVQGPFNPDPPLSFIVDSKTNGETLEALGRALNAGAIILAPEPGGEVLLSSLRGKRFRLSYMLAPGYGLPLNLGRPMALSHIADRAIQQQPQLSLLKDDD
ncbi:ORC-CDC6 family AAA ATPase [Bradyrhizobium oligotrophicum]|uniref:ORC-CDC6 family AAA ATPase n=1 Tax=Bradyrhizobium oligotrophicum TaxID=44255 RepID=UPI003EBD3F22